MTPTTKTKTPICAKTECLNEQCRYCIYCTDHCILKKWAKTKPKEIKKEVQSER